MEASEVARLLTTVAFVVLTVAALREWWVRRAPAAGWFVLSFLLVTVVAISGYVLPDDSESAIVAAISKLTVVGLVFFPYLLYRMTAVLKRTPRWLDVATAAATTAVVIATLAVPASDFMDEGETSGLFVAYTVLFLLVWTLLSAVVAFRLWRAGRDEPVLTRRRMRTLAAAAVGLSVALLLAPADSLALVTQLLALASAILFFVGFVAPRILRRPLGEDPGERFTSAVTELISATTAEDVTLGLLRNVTEAVGGRGAALVDRRGEVIARHGSCGEAEDGESAHPSERDSAGERVELPLGSSTLVVWTGPFTPLFGRHDLDVMSSLGSLAELALERSEAGDRERDAHEALRRQVDFSRMLVDSSVDGIMAFDRNYRYTLWNHGMERIAGMSADAVIGRSAFEVFPFLEQIGEDRYFDEALAGRDATSTDRRYEVPATGAHGYFEARYSPLHGSEGEVVGGLAIIREITDRKRAETEREQRQREELARAAAEARNRMVENLQAVTDAALGHLSLDAMITELLDRIKDMLEMDVAALALLDDDGGTLLVRAAVGFETVEPEGVGIPSGSGFFGRVASERRPIAVEEVTRAQTHTGLLQEEGIRSMLGVPMIVRSRLIGAIAVGRREQCRFTREDTGWLQLVADRVALAVEQASVYEREHRIAQTLQRSLLPESFPELPGLGIAARYLAGGAGAVGGDWYDVIELADGRVGLAIGDVVGHGVGAASLMGQMRSALRAYALEDERPSNVIKRLDRLLHSTGPSGMATLLYLVFDADRSRLSLATAGHPPPLIREPNGGVRFLETRSSVPLGVQSATQFEDRVIELSPGSTLLLYTDGLVERRGATLDQGFEQLERVMADAPDDPAAICEHILREVLPEDPADDTALLVVQSAAGPVGRLHLRPPADPAALASVRDALRRWLQDVGLGPHEASDVLVASGEACANAIEHAYGAADASFQLDAWVEDGEVAILVRDFGEWRPPRGRERGRGIELMRELMDSAEVTQDPHGTSVSLRRAVRAEAMR